jgi:hypothetical protein
MMMIASRLCSTYLQSEFKEGLKGSQLLKQRLAVQGEQRHCWAALCWSTVMRG